MITLDKMQAQLDAIAEAQGKLLAALNEHHEWAKQTHVIAGNAWEQSKKEHESKLKEWRGAASDIAGLLVRLHERLDAIEKRGVPPKRKAKR